MQKLTTLFGPPGTGKTTTLSKWAKQAAGKYGGENIMICSLTRTAATEIASRETDVPSHNVGTLHAHAYRSAEDGPQVMPDDTITDWNETYPAWAIPQTRIDEDESQAVYGSSFLGRYDLLRARGIDAAAYPVDVADFAQIYEEFKQQRSVIDFTDMILHAIRHVDCPVKYIIMDEAQDCSTIEFQLLTKWAHQCRGAVLAGDDDQAAYEWRGASVDAFLSFCEDHKVLNQSYRLPSRVKERADSWIKQIANRKVKEYKSRPGATGFAVEMEYRRPEEVVDHALSQPGTSMILTTCGYQTLPFVHRLKELAVPFCNPYRVRGDFASTWNPLKSGGTKALSVTDSVRSYLSPAWTWQTAFAWLRELTGLPRGSKKLLEENRKNTDLMPIETLIGIIGEEGFSAALSGDPDWLLRNLKSDPKRRSQIQLRLRVAGRFGSDALSKRPDIIVGTIHSVKGGQADNVYLLPDLSSQAREAWQLRGETAPIIRQMYIGMTRASERLFLLRPPRNSALRWS